MKSKLLAVTPGPLWTGSCLNLCLHWSCSGHSGCLQCLWLSALKSFRCRVSTFSVREVPFTLLCLAPSHYLSFTSNGPSSMLPSLTTEYVIWHSPRFILCGRLCIIFFITHLNVWKTIQCLKNLLFEKLPYTIIYLFLYFFTFLCLLLEEELLESRDPVCPYHGTKTGV